MKKSFFILFSALSYLPMGYGQSGVTSTSGAAMGSRVSGQVVSKKVSLLSFKVAGHISKHNVEQGQKVKRGSVIAVLDNTDFKTRKQIAEQSYELAKINAEQAQKDLDREKQLQKENASSVAALEKVMNTYKSAQISLTQASLSLKQADQSLKDTVLVAPFDGGVSKKFTGDGQYVNVGASVVEFIDFQSVEVVLKVPEPMVSRIKAGTKVAVSFPSLGKESTMTITRMAPVVKEDSRTFEVFGSLDNKDGKIIPGLFVEARFE